MKLAALAFVLAFPALAIAGPPEFSETKFAGLTADRGGVWISGYQDCTEAGQSSFLFHADGRTVVAASPATVDAISGAVLLAARARSTDRGRTWLASNRLEDIFAVWAGEHGLVISVGRNGVILRSTDSGATWTPSKSNTEASLLAVSGTGNTVFAVGDAGTIVASSDGGVTWKPRSIGATVILRDVWVDSATHAIAVGDTRNVFVTRDGMRWTSTRPTSSADAWFAHVVGSGSEVYAIGNHSLISHDAGATWRPITGDLEHASFVAVFGGDIYALIPFALRRTTTMWANGTVLHSSDGGSTWSTFATIQAEPRSCRSRR